MTDRLKAFTVDELHALVFRLNLAETIERLHPVAERLREEMVAELRERSTNSNPPNERATCADSG